MAENVLEKIINNKIKKIVNLKKTISLESLDELINTSNKKELDRLKDYSYEYFITYTPAADGSTTTPISKTASGVSGGDISESSSYKSGTSEATYFTIYSCGCDASKNQCQTGNIVTALESYVSKVN